MNTIHVIDLYFQEESHSIASFLIETSEGPVIIDTGPESTWESLKKGIHGLGYKTEDVKNILLTHIHFDHAGAAWKFAKHGAKIHVHPIGLPHLANPEKLWNSAAQIYGENMDRLWGSMEAIAENLLIPVNDGDKIRFGSTEFTAWYTPGHAVHHNAYQLNQIVFTGDVGGVKIENGPVVPPCPPPDINIGLWKESIAKIRALQPKVLYLTHFAKSENPVKHLKDLEIMLDDWADFIKPYYDKGTDTEKTVPLFMEYTQNQLRKNGVSEEHIQTYEYANPSWMSVAGLYRYWKLKEQGRI